MNIVLCADEHYAMPCGICVTSILENNKDCSCHIYVLTNGFSDKTKALFAQLEEKYKQKVEIIDIDTSAFKGLKVSNRFRESIYYRFFIPDIVEGEKALYLDSDIIVNASLQELWNIDLDGYACAVVEDQCGDDIRLSNRIGINSIYFNSGVMLMNLEYWRENLVKEKLISYIYNNPERCLYPDQDALNVILEDKVIYTDYRFNLQDLMLLDKYELFLHRDKWSRVDDAQSHAVIIHYTSNKPWYVESIGIFKKVFLKYKEISPWKEFVLWKRVSLREKFVFIFTNLLKKILCV